MSIRTNAENASLAYNEGVATGIRDCRAERDRLRDLLREAAGLLDSTCYNGLNFHEAKNALLARIREAIGEGK